MPDTIEPFIFVVLGGTGDLMRRKLLPALSLLRKRFFREIPFIVLGVSRRPWDHTQYREWLAQAVIEQTGAVEQGSLDHFFFHSLPSESTGAFISLRDAIETLERQHGLPGNRIFYMALPPMAFEPTLLCLGQLGLSQSPGWTRLVIEKPFGYDLASARRLNEVIHNNFTESQVFRIDHYLGKETVQNLLFFRFANYLFESAWNRDRIHSVLITVAEDIGLEGRSGYFDGIGVVRDMIQNHVMQLLTLMAMEVPVAFNAESIHYEKLKVLKSIRPIAPADVVLGQYTKGEREGKVLLGYREEAGVQRDSLTETFAALEIHIDNWRWRDVPFLVRTGKRMPLKLTQIIVNFRSPPVCLFESMDPCTLHRNELVITLQPAEGFTLMFDIKEPGEPVHLRELPLHFMYKEAFGTLPDAYETLLLDILMGDLSLFVQAEETEQSWRLCTPILEAGLPVHPYPAGTWGPPEAERLVRRYDLSWRTFTWEDVRSLSLRAP